jgi:hypothetical protein
MPQRQKQRCSTILRQALGYDRSNYRQEVCSRIGASDSGVPIVSLKSSEGDIRQEVDRIAQSGHFVALPEAKLLLAKTESVANGVLQNSSPRRVHVLLSGPVDRQVDIQPGDTTTLALPPGWYRVAVRADGNVRPLYGVQVLEAGIEYTSQFK